jgi:hypothetical protein
MSMPPQNYKELIKEFGNIRDFIFEDGSIDSYQWETIILDVCPLPFPMKLAWNPSIEVSRFRCHHRMISIFQEAFDRIWAANLESECQFFGGCYMFRCKKGSKKISTHAWGIAIDLNPLENQMGTPGQMNPDIVSIFESLGFTWGGRWQNPDPMHFQFCSGY